MAKQNITAYPNDDGDPTAYGICLGNGTPMQDITITGFPFRGGGTPMQDITITGFPFRGGGTPMQDITITGFPFRGGGTPYSDESKID